MTQSERDTILNEWREAYRKANGKEPPTITRRGSWYVIGMSKYRIGHFPAMTMTLLNRVKDE